jgi:hypothetical protein
LRREWRPLIIMQGIPLRSLDSMALKTIFRPMNLESFLDLLLIFGRFALLLVLLFAIASL